MATKQKEETTYELTLQDRLEILGNALQILREGGLLVGVRNVPAKVDRPEGIMIFAGNVQYTGESFAVTAEKVTQ